jgi:hypothetical protein
VDDYLNDVDGLDTYNLTAAAQNLTVAAFGWNQSEVYPIYFLDSYLFFFCFFLFPFRRSLTLFLFSYFNSFLCFLFFFLFSF